MVILEDELISEDDFFEIWGAYVHNNGDLFQFQDVKNELLKHVWTLTDSGGGRPDHWIASPGFHLVNVIGYVMTRRPWSNSTPDAFYSFDDFDWSDESPVP